VDCAIGIEFVVVWKSELFEFRLLSPSREKLLDRLFVACHPFAAKDLYFNMNFVSIIDEIDFPMFSGNANGNGD